MKDFIATIYESPFYNSDFQKIFDALLYEGGVLNGYTIMMLLFIVIPIIVWSLFYFVYKKPLITRSTWVLWWVGTAVIVFGLTFGIIWNRLFSTANNDLLNLFTDAVSGYASYTKELIIEMSLYNAGLAMLWGFGFSMLIKKWSKQYIHLPF